MMEDEYENCELHQEPIQQYFGILNNLQKNCSMAIQDDY